MQIYYAGAYSQFYCKNQHLHDTLPSWAQMELEAMRYKCESVNTLRDNIVKRIYDNGDSVMLSAMLNSATDNGVVLYGREIKANDNIVNPALSLTIKKDPLFNYNAYQTLTKLGCDVIPVYNLSDDDPALLEYYQSKSETVVINNDCTKSLARLCEVTQTISSETSRITLYGFTSKVVSEFMEIRPSNSTIVNSFVCADWLSSAMSDIVIHGNTLHSVGLTRCVTLSNSDSYSNIYDMSDIERESFKSDLRSVGFDLEILCTSMSARVLYNFLTINGHFKKYQQQE